MRFCLPGNVLLLVVMGSTISAMQEESGYIQSPFGHVHYIKKWFRSMSERPPIILCVDRTLEGPEDVSNLSFINPVFVCTLLEAKKLTKSDPCFAEKTFACFKDQLDFESFYLLGGCNEFPVLGYYDPKQKGLISCVIVAEIQFGVVGWTFGVKEILENLKVRGRQQGRILNFSIDEERSEIMDYFFSGNFPWASFVFVDKPSQ